MLKLLVYLREGPQRIRHLFSMLSWIGLRKGDLASVVTLTLAQTLTEGIGLGLLYPLLAFVEGGAAAFSAGAAFPLPQIARAIEAMGLPLSLPVLLGVVFVAFALREAVTYGRASMLSRIAYNCSSGLQTRAAGAYIEADLPFHAANNRGALFASLAADCAQSGTLIQLVAELLALLCMGLVYGLVLAALSVKLMAMIGGVSLVVLIVFRRQVRRVAEIGGELTEANKRFTIRINETFQAIRLIKVRAQEPAAIKRIAENSGMLRTLNWQRDRLNAAMDSLSRPIFLFAALSVFFVALTMLHATLASLVTFIFVTTRLIPVITRLGALRGLIPSYLRGPQNVQAQMSLACKSQKVVTGSIAFTGIGDGIRFEDVSFHYAEASGRPALDGVSLTVRPGEMAAFVGPSGAGKSTLADLLCRFYDPAAGRIVIGGRDLRDYDLASYRARLSFVPQEPVMFDDTIRANLEFGLSRPLTEDEIEDALNRAQCAEFVTALPQGVDTLIGERAVRLSGGQRQRLALARALASKPALLLLDEPTSALDSVSEQAIQQALRDLHGQVTILVVAHRLSTIADADRILVMQAGRIAAEGTHESLMRDGGIYYKLFKAQADVADVQMAADNDPAPLP